MQKIKTDLLELIKQGEIFISSSIESELSYKPYPHKWSKKEILGHLIDSGINNLQRFTEIQFCQKPYKIRQYNQDELVIANQYQKSNIKELLNIWLAINTRIIHVIDNLSDESSSFEILIEDKIFDLRFLIEDYVVHMRHHLKQIFS